MLDHYIIDVRILREKVPSLHEYPFSLPSIAAIESITFQPGITFIVGENGTGKSTLVEALAVAYGLNAEGGSRNFNFDTHASHSELWRFLKLSKGYRRPKDAYFFRAESFYNVASEIERIDAEPGPGAPITPAYGGTSLHKQSHGESFWSFMNNRLRGNGLYFFDEPEAALSPTRQLALLVKLDELVKADAQLIIATHSPIVLAYPGATILQISETGLSDIAYDEAECVVVTRQFLNDPRHRVQQLLASD